MTASELVVWCILGILNLTTLVSQVCAHLARFRATRPVYLTANDSLNLNTTDMERVRENNQWYDTLTFRLTETPYYSLLPATDESSCRLLIMSDDAFRCRLPSSSSSTVGPASMALLAG